MVGRIEHERAMTSFRVPGLKGADGKFAALLQEKLSQTSGLKLSAHAARRLRERNVSLSSADLARLERAVETAAAKGTREVLLLYGELTLIASTVNRTVVTAVPRAEGQVFTNIDGAVIVK